MTQNIKRSSQRNTLIAIPLGTKRRWDLFGYTPNEWASLNLHGRTESIIIGATGRQVGKSTEIAMYIDEGMNAEPDAEDYSNEAVPFVGILGSTYDKAEISVNRYMEMLTKTFGRGVFNLNKNKHELVIADPLAGKVGARLKWLSAEDAYNVVGFTFSRFAVDEAQAIPDEVWYKFIPTAGVRNARGLVFGTPDISVDQTWFEGLYIRGQDPLDTAFHSFSVASWEAPWMPMTRILEAKTLMTDSMFRRLYGGEWIEEEGRVFQNIGSAYIKSIPEFDVHRKYIMSYDPAAVDDFNVVLVGDPATRVVIHKDRWQTGDLLTTYDRVEDTWERYGRPKVYMDETAMGGIAVGRELRARGMRVVGTAFNNTNKMEYIQALASDIQHRRIMFPEWDDLVREFRSFIYKRTPMGKVTASAVSGAHDDIVTALLLINQGFRRSESMSNTFSRNYLSGSRIEEIMANV